MTDLIKSKQHYYSAKVVRVIDGDTIVVDIDLGFNISLNDIHLRLARINTPEIRGSERVEGLKSKEYVQKILEGETILIHTIRCDAWRRWIADIYIGEVCVNDDLVDLGYAEYKKY